MNPAAYPCSAITRSESDNRPVLVDAPLRPGFDRENLSRYGDATWDLGVPCSARTSEVPTQGKF